MEGGDKPISPAGAPAAIPAPAPVKEEKSEPPVFARVTNINLDQPINVPRQAPPVITTNVESPTTNVHIPEQKMTKKVPHRDGEGRIISVTEEVDDLAQRTFREQVKDEPPVFLVWEGRLFESGEHTPVGAAVDWHPVADPPQSEAS